MRKKKAAPAVSRYDGRDDVIMNLFSKTTTADEAAKVARGMDLGDLGRALRIFRPLVDAGTADGQLCDIIHAVVTEIERLHGEAPAGKL